MFDLDIIGATADIEVPVSVEFLDARLKPFGFTAQWKRESPEEAQASLHNIKERERELDGAELIAWQAGLISDRLLGAKGFPVKGGKKIVIGEGTDYATADWLEKVLTVRAYHDALYKSMISSLADKNLFEGERRKN